MADRMGRGSLAGPMDRADILTAGAHPRRVACCGKRAGLIVFLAALFVAAYVQPGSAAIAIEGTLFERHGETLNGETVDRAFFLATPHGQIRFSEAQPAQLVGQPVTVSDADSTQPALQGQARAANPDERLKAAPPPGPQSVLVLILTTPDDPSPASNDPEAAREQIFTATESAGAYYAQQSNGTTILSGRVDPVGDVVGPIALNTTMEGCPVDSLAAEADTRATAAGYVPSAYDHVIYLLPHSGECAFAGLGQLPGRRVWSNGYLFGQVLAHELGHNMGAHHANLLSCTDSLGAPTPYSATCTSEEYGDPFDVMGSSTALMGAFHRLQIGQLPESQVVRLRQSGTIPVTSSEDFVGSGGRLVLVPIKHPHVAVSEYFAIDSRGPLAPFNTWESTDPVSTGLTIRKVSDSGGPALQTQLLNMHPDRSALESALQPGETFEDPSDGVVIRADSTASGALQAEVSLPALTDDVPPRPPPWLFYSADSRGAHLSWPPGTDDVGVSHYRLLRDGVELGTTTALSFDDPGAARLAQATYGVITVDTSGNESSPIFVTLSFTYSEQVFAAEGMTGVKGSVTPSAARLMIDSRIHRDRRGRPLLSVRCVAPRASCVGTLRVGTRLHGRQTHLGNARYEIRSGTQAYIPITIVKQMLAVVRTHALTIRVTATVQGGPSTTWTCSLPRGNRRRF